MKRFLLYFLAFAPLAVFAQLNGSGYYRVQNVYTERYISIVDTEAEVSTSGIDLRALHMLKPFEDSVAYNPATICYVDLISSSTCNLKGQGMDLKKATGGHVLTYLQRPDGTFWFYGKVGSGASVTKYLFDESYEDFAGKFPIVYYPNTDAGGKEWLVHPVNQSETNYFGVKPDIAATDGSYWATMYAGFPFKPSDASTKVYTVCDVDNAQGYAVIEELTGDVTAETPVLFLCGSATPSGNKLTLLDLNTTANSGINYLQGNYYCNDVAEKTGHRNVRAYDPARMRMLGVDADGKPAFVKSSINYLPANKAYLAVSSSAPNVLRIITKEEYITGIHEMNTSTTDDTKVIYDLQGRRVQAPSKGLYIVNGKKMISR